MSSIWGCHRNLFSTIGPSRRCSVSVSIFWPSNQSLNDKSESWCFCHVVITIDSVSTGLMSVWLALRHIEIRFRQTFSFFHFLKFTRCLFLLYEVLCHPREWVALCRIWSLWVLNGVWVVVYRPLFIIVWMCWPVVEDWRVCVCPLEDWRVCFCALSIWMALFDLVLLGGGGGGCFFLFSFFMSLNLSSKVWHLLHNSSFCPSWYSLTAVKSCTCSNFCWWTRTVRDGLNVAVFELMV